MQDQLALNLSLSEEVNFENFFVADNQEVVTAVQNLVAKAKGEYIYLWGGESVGKSHLLQACCKMAFSQGRAAFYLPLGMLDGHSPTILENLEQFSLVAIDDIHYVAGDKCWEEALFHFFNQSIENNLRLLIAGHVPPLRLLHVLPDLKSRLASGVAYQLKPLSDEQKQAAMQLKARGMGFALSEDVAKYLLRHHSRNTAKLFMFLRQLDKASLEAQQRLTIPFVRTIMLKLKNQNIL